MDWVITTKLRCDIVGFTGLNLSGERKVVEIHPFGGRQGDFKDPIKSVAIVAPLGTRIVFSTAAGDDETWEKKPWRAVVMMKGHSLKNEAGDTMVRIPDLELLSLPSARRVDPEALEVSYDHAETLSAGTSWTFGREGTLKGKVKTIRIEKVP